MNTSRLILGSVLVAAVLVALVYAIGRYIPLRPTFSSFNEKLAIATTTTSVAPIDPITILIVPGHDDFDGGAVFGTAAENDLTRELGEQLYKLLEADPRFLPQSVRNFNEDNTYTTEFATYFVEQRQAILDFLKEHKEQSLAKIRSGEFKERITVMHNEATSRAVVILYGINKWANDHDTDLVLHIHFNNDARNNYNIAGRQSGFAIYTPEAQMPNYEETISLTQNLYKNLKLFTEPSTLSIEQSGLVESQDLIAIGAYGTRTGPSVLIEYGYIYEPKFQKRAARGESIKELAYATYLGLVDHYFTPVATSTATSTATTSVTNQ